VSVLTDVPTTFQPTAFLSRSAAQHQPNWFTKKEFE
jgi:hypothetical protein